MKSLSFKILASVALLLVGYSFGKSKTDTLVRKVEFVQKIITTDVAALRLRVEALSSLAFLIDFEDKRQRGLLCIENLKKK